jgi:hypothetical protein
MASSFSPVIHSSIDSSSFDTSPTPTTSSPSPTDSLPSTTTTKPTTTHRPAPFRAHLSPSPYPRHNLLPWQDIYATDIPNAVGREYLAPKTDRAYLDFNKMGKWRVPTILAIVAATLMGVALMALAALVVLRRCGRYRQLRRRRRDFERVGSVGTGGTW